MPCPTSTASTPQTSPKTFTSWDRDLTFVSSRSFRPSTRGEIVEIIRQAEEAGQRVKWTGSLWSFTGVYVSNDVVIESDGITGVVNNALFLDRLTLADPSLRASLVQVKGGTKVFNVNRLLHGLPLATTGGGADENNLNCTATARALPTLGGSGGQSIAGVMATGSHGGDIHLPPIPDCVQAIHLIGPGGQEFWIERSRGLTAGSEADTQAELRNIIGADPAAAVEMCNDVIVRKNDDLSRAVLVSVGRMGFVYSLVVRSVPAFKLAETRSENTWETYRTNLGAENFARFTADKYFLNVLINPFSDGGPHTCKISERNRVECSTANVGMAASGGFDFTALFCQRRDIRVFLPILFALLAGLLFTIGGLIVLSTAELAAASALAAIPFIGWALAAAMFAVYAATLAAIAVLSATVAALTGLIGYLTVSGGLTGGELIAAIANFAYRFGLRDLMRAVLTLLFNSAYPLDSKTGVSWKIMDTYGYAGEDFCQKVDSMEFAFDVAAATDGGGYLAFIDEVLAIFDDLYARNVAVAGLLAVRYTGNTESLIGMTKFAATCHIEIPILKRFGGNAEFLARVQAAAITHGGVPHWGQMMNGYSAADIARLHGDDLRRWRLSLTELIRSGRGGRFTFSNDFTMNYNLEPFDDTPISAVRFTITVGDDSLGDTDWLRHDVSADFARVTLRDGTFFEVSLNEGTTWPSRTTHSVDVPVAAGTAWGDVASVRIQHNAAGNDWNADNWTMNEIIITSVASDDSTTEQFRRAGRPVWQFRKNDNQIWQHNFM